MNVTHRILPVILSALFLNGCGGSSDKPTPLTPPPIPPVVKSFAINGYAVKGPLQNATVNIYALDDTKADFKGRLVTSGSTNELAAFSNIQVSEPLSDYYLIEIVSNDKTIDVTTGQQPVLLQLYSILSAEQLTANTAINATPLTTIISQVANQYTLKGNSVNDALLKAIEQVQTKLNFGLVTTYNPFTDAPLLSASSDFTALLSHRVQNEAFAALLEFISVSVGVGVSESLKLVAADYAEQLSQFDAQLVSRYQTTIEQAPIPHLVVTYSDKDGDPTTQDPFSLNEIKSLLVQEQVLLSSGLDTSALSDLANNFTPKTLGLDTDADGFPNQIDLDDDNDGIFDGDDAFPLDSTETIDTDNDGIGNNADTDDDNDGVPDSNDAFPLDATESVDTDLDGIGNNADTDDDNDGVPDSNDAFPLDATESVDTDLDGIGNNADTDDDNDGVLDADDAFPLDASESKDSDNDGVGDNADAFPNDGTETLDTDKDGIGNNADTDDDNDGVPDDEDDLPLDPTETVDTDKDGIGNNADTDDDNDGTADTADSYPLDNNCYLNTDGEAGRCYLTWLGDSPSSIIQARDNEYFYNLNYRTDDPATSFSRILLQNKINQHFSVIHQSEYVLANLVYHAGHNKVYFTEKTADLAQMIYSVDASYQVLPFHEVIFEDIYNPDYKAPPYIESLVSSGSLLAVNKVVVPNYSYFFEWQVLQNEDNYYPMGGYALLSKNAQIVAKSYDGKKAEPYPSYERFMPSPSDSQSVYSVTGKGLHRVHRENSAINRYIVFVDNDNVQIKAALSINENFDEYGFLGGCIPPFPIQISDDGKELTNLIDGKIFSAGTLVQQGRYKHKFTDNILGSRIISSDSNTTIVANYGNCGEADIHKIDKQGRVIAKKNFGYDYISLASAKGDTVSVVYRSKGRYFFEEFEFTSDSDLDGILNEEDAFPLDAAASVDTDQDGYPDFWNADKSQADSTTRLKLDEFPTEYMCWSSEQATNGGCDYAKSAYGAPNYGAPNDIVSAGDRVYLLYSKVILVWSLAEQRFLTPIYFKSDAPFSFKVAHIAYSDTLQRLYLASEWGEINYIDVSKPEAKLLAFYQFNAPINAMKMLNNTLAVETTALQLLNVDAALINPQIKPRISLSLSTWSAKNHTLYLDAKHFIIIEPQSGAIIEDKSIGFKKPYDSPYLSGLYTAFNYLVNSNAEKFSLTSGQALGKLSEEFKRKLKQSISISNRLFAVEVEDYAARLVSWDELTETFIVQSAWKKKTTLVPYLNSLVIVSYNSQTNTLDFDYQFSTDADNDGLPAWWELQYQLNDSDASDALQDNDNDGLNNLAEFKQGTHPALADTDSDGLNDGNELQYAASPLLADTDYDGLTDEQEVNQYQTQANSSDSDNDGLSDFAEVTLHFSNPNNADSDGDGMSDGYEIIHQLNVNANDADQDLDADGLSNQEEATFGTSPRLADTDGDGLSDYDEIKTYLTSAVLFDTDGDRLGDWWELNNQFNPLDSQDGHADSDADGFSNAQEFYLNTDLFNATDVPQQLPWAMYGANANKTNFTLQYIDTTKVRPLWQQSFFRDIRTDIRQLLVQDNNVYVMVHDYNRSRYDSSFGSLYVLDAVTGNELRSKKESYRLTLPILHNDKLFYTNDSYSYGPWGPIAPSRVFNIEDLSGVREFSHNTGSYISKSPNESTVIAYKNQVRITGYSWEVVYNTDTQALTGESDDIDKSLESKLQVVANDTVVVSEKNTIKGYHYLTHELLFDVALNDPIKLVTHSRDQALIIQTDKQLLRFNLNTLSTGWVINDFKVSDFNPPRSLSHAMGYIYAYKDDFLVQIDELNGQVMWQVDVSANYSNIVVGLNKVIVASRTETFIIDINDQSVVTLPSGGNLLALDNGVLFIAKGSLLTAYAVNDL